MEKVISYEPKFKSDKYRLHHRNPKYWAGEIESGFEYFYATDEKICEAYEKAGVKKISLKKIKATKNKS